MLPVELDCNMNMVITLTWANKKGGMFFVGIFGIVAFRGPEALAKDILS